MLSVAFSKLVRPQHTPMDPKFSNIVLVEETDQKECECHKPHADNLDGFLQTQSKRVARNPCIYFWTALFAATALSIVAMIVGEFSIEVSSKGWVTRGTTISDRQSASILIRTNMQEILEGGEDVWNNLLWNLQPSWEDFGSTTSSNGEEDETSSLQETVLPLDPIFPPSISHTSTDSEIKDSNAISLHLSSTLRRRLEEYVPEDCDIDFYFSTHMTGPPRLWPVWKLTEIGTSILSPEVIHEICLAEEATQRVLVENGLCIGCDNGCMAPFSLVLYARLTILDGFNLSCSALRDAWVDYQESAQQQWATCVADIEASSVGIFPGSDVPQSCPFAFSTHMVDTAFGDNSTYSLTSSIFVSDTEKLDELYNLVGQFDKGTNLVQGSYDTQKQNFNFRYQTEALQRDLILAFGSAVIVVAAMLVHTRSVFVTVVGLVQIILSFPLAFFVYRFIAGYSYFPVLNFIGVFVSFAIGADDVFVAVDKMKNARLDHPQASTEEIAARALPDAAHSMLLTTLTTSLAFFATSICPVAPIKLFSIFVGLLVALVYCLCVFLVFPALCIYDRVIRKRGSSTHWLVIFNPSLQYMSTSSPRCKGNQSSFIRRVLSGYHRILHKHRYVFLMVCLTALGVTAYHATQLPPPTSLDVRLLEGSNEYEKNYQWRQRILYEDLKASAGSRAFVYWGVQPADTGDHGKFYVRQYFSLLPTRQVSQNRVRWPDNPETFTRLVLDDSFDPSTEEAQSFLLGFCDELYEQPFATRASENYICPMTSFDLWLRHQHEADSKNDIYTSVCLNATQVPVAVDSFHKCFSAWARETGDVNVLTRNDTVTILYMPFKTQTGYKDRIEDIESEFWVIENWMDDKLKSAPQGVNQGFFIGADFWFFDTYRAMTATAINSVAIALATSALVIFVSSRSAMLTLYSVLSILYVLTSTTATMVALGWTLGFMECICMAILIGISADFVTHFSNAYVAEIGSVAREHRTKHALIYMGPSVLAAAFTTAAAAVIMIFTVILFFRKFAYILFFTIIHSTTGAFIFFLTLTECFGPLQPAQLVTKVLNKVGGCNKSKTSELEVESIAEATNLAEQTVESSTLGWDLTPITSEATFHDDAGCSSNSDSERDVEPPSSREASVSGHECERTVGCHSLDVEVGMNRQHVSAKSGGSILQSTSHNNPNNSLEAANASARNHDDSSDGSIETIEL